jgi:hypothetical protein
MKKSQLKQIIKEEIRKILKEDININNIDPGSLEFSNVHGWDAPDYADAYVMSANYNDGTPLSEEELEELDNHRYWWDPILKDQ